MAKENLVLLPIQGKNLTSTEKRIYDSAIVEGLSLKYEVFSGNQVIEKLKKYQIVECNEKSCLEKIAIAFNGSLVARGFIESTKNGYLLSIEIKDIFTDKNIFTKSIGCSDCSKSDIIENFKAMASGKIFKKEAFGEIFVNSNPYIKGTKIYVNGEEKGEIPATLKLKSGQYLLKVENKDLSGTKLIKIKTGVTSAVTMDLNKPIETANSFNGNNPVEKASSSILSLGLKYHYFRYKIHGVFINSSNPDSHIELDVDTKSYGTTAFIMYPFSKHFAVEVDYYFNEGSIERELICNNDPTWNSNNQTDVSMSGYELQLILGTNLKQKGSNIFIAIGTFNEKWDFTDIYNDNEFSGYTQTFGLSFGGENFNIGLSYQLHNSPDYEDNILSDIYMEQTSFEFESYCIALTALFRI